MTRHSNRRRTPAGPSRGGFTLVELLIVFVILAILIALLLPAINGAVKTAKNSAVTANLKQLDAALAAFKSKYGDFPPSRVILYENGYFQTQDQTLLAGNTSPWSDMTAGQLAQRSLAALRKLFPKVVFSTSAPVWTTADKQWYDFNGNGVFDTAPYVLQGHQCLTFFLGGLPQQTSEGFAMTGFAKNPANPFTPAVNTTVSTFYSQNREAPLFEFDSSRLVADTINDPSNVIGIPGYIDTLGSTTLGNGQINFIAYFSAYGNNAYDPNDVNFASEADEAFPPLSPILTSFNVRFPVKTSNGTVAQFAASPAPNPYCSTTTTAAVVNFVNPQTYQLISSGVDGLYGPGGQFNPNAAAGVLPYSSTTTNSTDARVRQREQDNLTNFRGGRLD
ncbi:type II secretion system protein [Paludisphaera rhizosphaerae]|uniref:type II secretion system protein n=1 Tax=Paludisphaera rhizosphaerae TaxID=2711216 RepID=UPI0013EC78D1|nr:prepilin-type N-terminal cleavage/methylation domain-containing protein [Paludisphaera rhizosphaerae]